MENGKNIGKWVDEVLGSTEGMKKAEGNPFLYEKIQFRLRDGAMSTVRQEVALLPKWIVAGLLILIINGIAINREINKGQNNKQSGNYAGMLSELGNQTTYNY